MEEKEYLIDLLIHDLTGPLSIVSTSVKNLLVKEDRYGKLSEDQRRMLRMILRNANRAQSFLHEMIEAYRSEEGLFRKESFLIGDALQEVLLDSIEIMSPDIAEMLLTAACREDTNRILEENGIIIEICGKYKDQPFVHDQKKIQQIMGNLITNALKYRKKTVKVSVTGDRDMVMSVEDDGEGIPKEKQDYIFKRFVFMKDKQRQDVRGLGFGLSCVKGLVEGMQGEISLASSEAKGTCFTVRIPPLP